MDTQRKRHMSDLSNEKRPEAYKTEPLGSPSSLRGHGDGPYREGGCGGELWVAVRVVHGGKELFTQSARPCVVVSILDAVSWKPGPAYQVREYLCISTFPASGGLNRNQGSSNFCSFSSHVLQPCTEPALVTRVKMRKAANFWRCSGITISWASMANTQVVLVDSGSR